MIVNMKEAQSPEDIRNMADHVARLMAERFGGARRGEPLGLQLMIRRRGGALPRRLRAQAQLLAEADAMTASPKIARQMDLIAPSRAHHALIRHLEPLGKLSRWQGRAVNFFATLALAFLLLGAIAIWVMLRRGML